MLGDAVNSANSMDRSSHMAVDHLRLAGASRWRLALEFVALAQAQESRWLADC
jgi:hypothetical protein